MYVSLLRKISRSQLGNRYWYIYVIWADMPGGIYLKRSPFNILQNELSFVAAPFQKWVHKT